MTEVKPTVYKRITDIQNELLHIELPKSGYNKFGNFKYHELEDISPTITKLCHERDLLYYFDFSEVKATLHIVDNEDDSLRINRFETSVPMPEIKELNKKMNICQSLGAYITYFKRYLLCNTFQITEKSVIDSTTLSELNAVKEKPQVDPVDDSIKEIVKELCNMAVSQGKRPLKGILIRCARKCEKLTEDEREQVISYIKTLPNGEVNFE